jgi:hypothetical protein
MSSPNKLKILLSVLGIIYNINHTSSAAVFLSVLLVGYTSSIKGFFDEMVKDRTLDKVWGGQQHRISKNTSHLPQTSNNERREAIHTSKIYGITRGGVAVCPIFIRSICDIYCMTYTQPFCPPDCPWCPERARDSTPGEGGCICETCMHTSSP